jgi:hypothetical protein
MSPDESGAVTGFVLAMVLSVLSVNALVNGVNASKMPLDL